MTCLGRTAGAVILKISHGYNVEDDDDPLVEMADRATNNFSVVTMPGNFLVDVLPICTFLDSVRFISAARKVPLVRYLPEWFPGCGFQKDAKRWRKMVREAEDTPYEFVLENLACFLFAIVVPIC